MKPFDDFVPPIPEDKLKEIKEKHKDDRQQQAQAMMEVYREAGMNPLASLALVFIQLPIIIALYFSVYSGGGIALPDINLEILYSFVSEPVAITMNFLGLIDITERSFWLALGAGVTQFIHVNLTMPTPPPREKDAAPNLKEDFMRNMHLQMKYVMPVLIGLIAYYISAAIALYFLVSNLVTIGQEYFVRKHR